MCHVYFFYVYYYIFFWGGGRSGEAIGGGSVINKADPILKKKYKVVKLVDGGSVFNGATPSISGSNIKHQKRNVLVCSAELRDVSGCTGS